MSKLMIALALATTPAMAAPQQRADKARANLQSEVEKGCRKDRDPIGCVNATNAVIRAVFRGGGRARVPMRRCNKSGKTPSGMDWKTVEDCANQFR
jgi:hypothetical protein